MKQSLREFATNVLDKLSSRDPRRAAASLASSQEIAGGTYHAKLRAMLDDSALDKQPDELFAGVSDDFWFWLFTEGYRESSLLRNILPGMPDETIQLTYTGDKGDSVLREAWMAYKLFKEAYERHGGPIAECRNILDFGCGWGRIIRFFLKDVAPSKLLGVDPVDEMINLCGQQNKWCNFEAISTRPPTRFPNDTFDLIYSFSVFSHLSEEMHQNWLAELSRILAPGGILIATTRSREFIEADAHFADKRQSLSEYDTGRYCFSQIVFEGEWSYWGEASIPRNYVLSNWTRWLTFLDYIDDRNRCSQNAIVMSKPVGGRPSD